MCGKSTIIIFVKCLCVVVEVWQAYQGGWGRGLVDKQ